MRYAIPICCLLVYLMLASQQKPVDLPTAQVQESVELPTVETQPVEQLQEQPKEQSQPKKSEPVRATVEYYYNDGCAACERWKIEVKPVIEASGWKVIEIKNTVNPVPYFIVIDPGVTLFHNGYLSVSKFNKLVTEARIYNQDSER